jgi:hypothetical protein
VVEDASLTFTPSMYPEITVPVEVMTTLCQLPSQTCRGPGRVVVAPETGMTEIKIEERLARRETKHAVRQERRHSNRRSTSR